MSVRWQKTDNAAFHGDENLSIDNKTIIGVSRQNQVGGVESPVWES